MCSLPLLARSNSDSKHRFYFREVFLMTRTQNAEVLVTLGVIVCLLPCWFATSSEPMKSLHLWYHSGFELVQNDLQNSFCACWALPSSSIDEFFWCYSLRKVFSSPKSRNALNLITVTALVQKIFQLDFWSPHLMWNLRRRCFWLHLGLLQPKMSFSEKCAPCHF